jgi:hypothetical protein
MINLLTNLLIKIIPNNWYETKKICDVITKICDTIIQLKWYAWLTVDMAIVGFTVAIVYLCRWKIVKIRYGK